MKRFCAAVLAALVLGLAVPQARAQTEIAVYIAQDALSGDAAMQVMELLGSALPEASFTLTQEGRTLGEMIMADESPQLVICSAAEAARWAGEGLFAGLDGCLDGEGHIAEAVLAACTQKDELYMLPLRAMHRRVAVNRRMLEEAQLGYLLEFAEEPVWTPLHLYQVLESCLLDGYTGMDVWPTVPQEADAVLAFMQSLYSGAMVSEETSMADAAAVQAGAQWLQEMVICGLIGMAQNRQAALERFLRGETVVFIDWTPEEERALAQSGSGVHEIVVMPYPSSSGIPVHAFEVTGAAVLRSGNEEKDALALAAAAFLMGNTQVQGALGDRAVFEDGALWLPCLNVSRRGSVLQGLLCGMVDAMLRGEIEAEAAMRAVSGGMRGQ